MKQETTIQESRMPFQQGWIGSIALHGLVFLSLFPLFRQSLTTIPNEPFHWDVMLVQSTPTAKESAETIEPAKPVLPKPPDRTVAASLANRAIRHAALSAEHSASLEPKTDAPVTPKSAPDSLSPVLSPKHSDYRSSSAVTSTGYDIRRRRSFRDTARLRLASTGDLPAVGGA